MMGYIVKYAGACGVGDYPGNSLLRGTKSTAIKRPPLLKEVGLLD
jgi:hypothetical protein